MNGLSYSGTFDGAPMDYRRDDENIPNPMMLAQDSLGGQSLDDIVNQNAKMMRRQSMPLQSYNDSPPTSHMGSDMRHVSVMGYGPTAGGQLNSLEYGAGTGIGPAGTMSGGVTPAHGHPGGQFHARRQSTSDISLRTSHFGNDPSNFNPGAFASPVHPQGGIDMSLESPYLDPGAGMNMDYPIDQNFNSSMGGNGMSANLYNRLQFTQSNLGSPMHSSAVQQGTPQSGHGSSHDASGAASAHSQFGSRSGGTTSTMRHMSQPQNFHAPDLSGPGQGASPMGAATLGNQAQPFQAHGQHAHSGFSRQPQNPPAGSSEDRGMGQGGQVFDGVNGPLPVNTTNHNPNNQNFPWETPKEGWPSTMVGRPHMQSIYKNAYSSTGFDMLGVLMRVATRPNPEINIGAVDLSCAFVVCDAEQDDFPVVYCSENFERLTGYTKHMVLGRNCRLLQSPDGIVAPGVPRKYVDDDSVRYLKNMINLRREAQISLINYRRGGQPFMNLLTMIPITWDSDQAKFFVGFQVDLVEQPSAVTNRNPDGSYSINYQRGMTMPRYVMNAPDPTQKSELGQTVPRDDVSAILSTIGSGESEYAKRIWDKVLLENTDDVVHVLSLKGLFQWISPSASRVLEYDPSEIIGTALSSLCHPSDIVPVTRELKDTSSGASVNVVFRIRRKNSGYMWFEGHGSLYTEQGKGRKSIIMVGRERPVYTLSKREITTAGGIGENELWTKMSTSGMFLYVSSNVRQLLDRQPDELIGVSIQSLMRTESKNEFARILEHARTGKKASVKHEVINRRGQVLSAFTTLYPGDATEGQKPTFIVAQTRLIKFSKHMLPNRPSLFSKSSSDSVQSNPASGPFNSQSMGDSPRPAGGFDAARFVNTGGMADTYAGQNGLVLGHQDLSLASEDNLFDELKTTKSSSWQYEIRQLEKRNRLLAEEVQSLMAAKKKRKRRKGAGNQQKDCANCHTRVTPEWRRGPSGQRDLCNSCGLRWAKLNGRVSPRTSSQPSVHSAASDKASKASASPRHPSVGHIKPEPPFHERSSGTATVGLPSGGSTDPDPSTGSNPPLAQKPTEGYASMMEGASGVPAKIDEGVEPD